MSIVIYSNIDTTNIKDNCYLYIIWNSRTITSASTSAAFLWLQYIILLPSCEPTFPLFDLEVIGSWRLPRASSNRSHLLTPTEVACRGERVRDFYQRQQGYAACQTEEKVSRLECRGSCPGGSAGQGTCCTPLRSKRRKYTFQCTDGSSFVQEVEKVVKCGCTKCSS